LSLQLYAYSSKPQSYTRYGSRDFFPHLEVGGTLKLRATGRSSVASATIQPTRYRRQPTCMWAGASSPWLLNASAMISVPLACAAWSKAFSVLTSFVISFNAVTCFSVNIQPPERRTIWQTKKHPADTMPRWT
jgi:hypothetical protein